MPPCTRSSRERGSAGCSRPCIASIPGQTLAVRRLPLRTGACSHFTKHKASLWPCASFFYICYRSVVAPLTVLNAVTATASYLAAIHAGVPVHHMAPRPLDRHFFPNVVPTPSSATPSWPTLAAALAAVPQAFTDIYAHSLPILVSASDIPRVLRAMHRALQPQGTLHLVLVDPAPVRASMGPRLQAWLDEHLLLNVERLFRCTSPTRLFPTWLRDAHFQVGPRAKIICPFAAVGRGEAQRTDGGAEAVEAATEADGEAEAQQRQKRLHSLVGQKLWQETWGPYVTAAQWWWEDEACCEECLALDTVWEYHMVDAVKKDRYVDSSS